ncbi:MAG: sxtJ [Candidatus Omnitrophica bacterium]|nr:sxtJ [Candidatus Omnitrophota bacterium]
MDLTQINKKQLREFGIGAAIFFAGIIPLIQFFKHHHPSIILISVGLVFGLLGIFIPQILKPIFYVTMKYVAGPLGWINTRILLSLVFYLLIMPIGFLMRLFGQDILNRKFEKNLTSYWIIRDGKPFDTKHYEKYY